MTSVENAITMPVTSVGAPKIWPADACRAQYQVAFGYLRTFITILVVAHHAFLAYHPYAPTPSVSFTSLPLIWAAFPVVDSHRWKGIDLLLGFNDIFFMSLMFFLSGLFVWPSLTRKGVGTFLRDRFVRLGLPFLFAAALLAPLAYYPAYCVREADPRPLTFWRQWLSLGTWPSGPAWFLWVLLGFACVAAAFARLAPRWGDALGRLNPAGKRHPIIWFLVLVAVSAVAYIPMTFAFDPGRWISWGPFYLQASRVLHYAVYFFAGIVVGAGGLETGVLASDGRLAGRWFIWVFAAPAAYLLAIIAFLAMLASMSRGGPSPSLQTIVSFTFVLSCATSSFAFLALFLRFAKTRVPAFDSLTKNAYGIYLTHYVFVTWLQFALLKIDLAGSAKGLMVFVGTWALSWYTIASLRRIPPVARVI